MDKARGGADLVVIDEIGKMEALSAAFRERVVKLLDLPTALLATIPTGEHPFVLSLLERRDVSVYDIDRRNRNKMKEVVEEDLLRILGHRRSPRMN
jgi:nucleoside-triphosphatase THEP1